MIADFSWKCERASGVLMHISSLPSEFGIGNFGRGADLFLDFLKRSGFTFWQMCPLGPTGFGDSPYQSFSAFAGNPYFIDLSELENLGLLNQGELEPLRKLSNTSCDFGELYKYFPKLLSLAYSRATHEDFDALAKKYGGIGFEEFCDTASDGLKDYFLFAALKEKFGGKSWMDWPENFRDSAKAKVAKLDEKTERALMTAKFEQWLFLLQCSDFKRRTNACGIKIFGDIPIFLSKDGADVWANRELFMLDSNGVPTFVSGVGPDYFSTLGQLWGNPLYDWDNAKEAVFDFWRKRLKASFEMFDVLRLDHFRGFADYWAIPADAGDARKGSWRLAPGIEFFKYVKRHFPTNLFVAEDLGLLSPIAEKLRDDIKIPAMGVLQFAFGGNSDNPYLPHNLKRENVLYTGTHDNSTSRGWYENATDAEKDAFRRYYRVSGKDVAWDMIYAALSSVSDLAIFPFQDVLRLDSDARMNTPGKPYGNWKWRATKAQIDYATRDCSAYLYSLNELFGRLPK